MDFLDRLELRATIRGLLEPTIERCGCSLVAVDLATESGGQILRLYIDAPGGVDISHCTRVSHAVSPELDVADPIPGSYNLEVSSPGIDRPVELPADFERFSGYRARVRLGPGPARRRYTGTLLGLVDGNVVIEVDGQEHRIPIEQVDHVRLDLDTEEFMQLGRALPAPEGDSR